jgi:hypothetical protein
MPSFGGEVKPSVPCKFTACKRSLNGVKRRHFGKITGHYSRPQFHLLLPRSARVFLGTWRQLAAKVGTSKGRRKQWKTTSKNLHIMQRARSHAVRLTGLWFLPKLAQRLNTTTTTTNNNNNNLRFVITYETVKNYFQHFTVNSLESLCNKCNVNRNDGRSDRSATGRCMHFTLPSFRHRRENEVILASVSSLRIMNVGSRSVSGMMETSRF